MKIWVDADACPKVIKEYIFKMAVRKEISTTLVANSYMQIPVHPLINLIQVEKGADIADFYIVENLDEGDIVITADIPLAALVVEKNAIGINPRGEMYTEENVQERLSMRNFLTDLRDEGVITGGPAPFGPKDKENFANTFSKILATRLK